MTHEEKTNILVVDDAVAIRKLITQHLREMGYLTRSVGSGEKAIDLLQSDFASPFDLVLLDQVMPGQDGITTFELIKSKLENPPPVIMVSAHGSIHLAVEFMKIGGFGFVQKPVDFDVLDLEIKRALEKMKLKRQRDKALAAHRAAQQAAVLVASATRRFHEPLSSIQGYAETLLKTQPKSERDALTERIIASALRLSKTVDDVIEAALLGSGAAKMSIQSISPDEIRALLPSGVEEKADSKELSIRYEINEKLPAFMANREQLKRILEHLFKNAIKFTGRGEVIFKTEE
ncbi:MAG: response regulator, partial [Deltaproteobacteria bacterium]|nr:response regulator [Deltaproteobacteria bacterium]